MNKILVIDDESQIRRLLYRMLELEGYEVFQASDCKSALKQIEAHTPEIILCDVFLPDGNGIDFIPILKKHVPLAEIILLTAHGNIPDGVQAIKNGAFDYITKGDDNLKIIPLVSRAMQQVQKKQQMEKPTMEKKAEPYTFHSILGNSFSIKEAIHLAYKVSVTDIPVLLTGETGTGKEVFAQAIHQESSRRRYPFMPINCAAFSKELLESEIFGHKAGAFTGALKDKKGLFEVADHGTLFLDEIGEMAFELQAKLLRVLETGEYIKIGDAKTTRIDVRLIAATNRNLAQEIQKGNFREDLFYRLSVFNIHLPALRDRKEDIEMLACHFIEHFCTQFSYPVPEITCNFLKALQSHSWKGNIRELRNIIERSLIVSNGIQLKTEDLPVEMQFPLSAENEEKNFSEFELAAMEKHHIIRVLQYTSGNKTETARLLKIGLTTLYRKIEEYNIKI